MVSFALGIPHTPWILERKVSFNRLQDGLRNSEQHSEYRQVEEDKVFAEREPNWSWSQKLWGWACDVADHPKYIVSDGQCAERLGPTATHLVQLQDDVIVGEEFWPTLRAMVEAKPNDVIGLETPMSCPGPWYATSDGLIGVGYVVPIPLLREFLTWRSTSLRADGYKQITEDTLLGLWCFVTGRPVIHPSVTIIDHDTSLASTYGNDGHERRRPARSSVRGDALPASWDGEPIHVGRFYSSTPRLARKWVKGYGFTRMQEDSCRP